MEEDVVKTSFYLSKDNYKRLRTFAFQNEITMTFAVNSIIEGLPLAEDNVIEDS